MSGFFRTLVPAGVKFVKNNPFGVAATIISAPIAIGITPAILGVIGFTATGVGASMTTTNSIHGILLTLILGSTAAAIHASIGNVGAGSVFSILQSAGAGGAGTAIVNGVVGGSTAVIAVGATAVRAMTRKKK
jgi:hypothetical protein